jgi:hypothetical protein
MTVLRFDPFQEFNRLSRQMLGSGRGPPTCRGPSTTIYDPIEQLWSAAQ